MTPRRSGTRTTLGAGSGQKRRALQVCPLLCPCAPPTVNHMEVVQGSFDELGRPLSDTTFCVVDLETTGGSAAKGSKITEFGAVKVRGGEVLGEFQTPGQSRRDDPGLHHGADRHHQPDGHRRPPHRRGAAELPRVRPRQRARRAQRAVRRRLPQALQPRARHPVAGLRDARHRDPRPPRAVPRGGAQLQARRPWRRSSRPPRRPTTGPCPTPARRSTSCTPCSSGSGPLGRHDARGGVDLHRQGQARAAPQAPPRRAPAARRPASTSSATPATRSSTSARPATSAPAPGPTSPRPRPAPAWARWSCSPSASRASSAPRRSRPRCASCA